MNLKNIKSFKRRPANSEWWDGGIRFKCQGSGKCCTSHGEFGFVFLTLKDRRQIARTLGLNTTQFTKKYCTSMKLPGGRSVWHLNEDPEQTDCMFLRGKACSIYSARPTQCRTWPFWPEVMNPKAWKKEVIDFCPGVGKGPLISSEQIQIQLERQKQSERELISK